MSLDRRVAHVDDCPVNEPDPHSWEGRLGYAVYKAMWAIGIPRPIRLALKWPFAILAVLISVLVVTPMRMIRNVFRRARSDSELGHRERARQAAWRDRRHRDEHRTWSARVFVNVTRADA